MTPRLPTISSKEMMKALLKADFYIHHQTGSHIILKREFDKKRVTLPFHNIDLHRGIVKSILNQAGLNEEKFLKLL